MYHNDDDEFIIQCLKQLFFMSVKDDASVISIARGLNTKLLLKALRERGFSYNVFDEKNTVFHLNPAILASHAMNRNLTAREFLSTKNSYPFSEEEIQVVEREYEKLKQKQEGAKKQECSFTIDGHTHMLVENPNDRCSGCDMCSQRSRCANINIKPILCTLLFGENAKHKHFEVKIE